VGVLSEKPYTRSEKPIMFGREDIIRPFCYESTCFVDKEEGEYPKFKKGETGRQGYAWHEMNIFLRYLRLISSHVLVTYLSNGQLENEGMISKDDVDLIAAMAIFNPICY